MRTYTEHLVENVTEALINYTWGAVLALIFHGLPSWDDSLALILIVPCIYSGLVNVVGATIWGVFGWPILRLIEWGFR